MIKDKDPQNGYGKPTQESPQTGQGLTMEELERTLAERSKHAPRESESWNPIQKERETELSRKNWNLAVQRKAPTGEKSFNAYSTMAFTIYQTQLCD